MKGNQIRFSPNFLAIPTCFTTTKCAHCKCSLPEEDGVFIAHMKECGPCPGFPRCPFEAHQCPFLSENTDTPSEYCAAALD